MRQARQRLGKCLLTSSMVAGAAWAQAQAPARPLVDPMRPADLSEATPSRETRSEPGVRVILTSPERKLAVIDGKVVSVGDEVRGGTLVGLTDSAAVLRKNGSRDVLLMHPSIDKRPPSDAPANTR
jgi:hypothetical protein